VYRYNVLARHIAAPHLKLNTIHKLPLYYKPLKTKPDVFMLTILSFLFAYRLLSRYTDVNLSFVDEERLLRKIKRKKRIFRVMSYRFYKCLPRW